MKIRVKKGVSGYRKDRSPYRYPAGFTGEVPDDIAIGMIRADQAEPFSDSSVVRPIAEAPMIERDIVIQAVVRRGRKHGL